MLDIVMPAGIKGFQKGHAAHIAKSARALASEVRAKVPADLMVDFYVAIAMGHAPVLAYDEDGRLAVQWQESGGERASLDMRRAAVEWLANRGHGQAAQLIAIEQTVRLDATGTGALQLGALAPAVLLAVRDALRLNAGASSSDAGDAPADPTGASELELEGAIDAEFSEVGAVDADPLPVARVVTPAQRNASADQGATSDE